MYIYIYIYLRIDLNSNLQIPEFNSKNHYFSHVGHTKHSAITLFPFFLPLQLTIM